LNFAIPYYGAYIEDKFQVNQNLTVSLEQRYDLSIPPILRAGMGEADFSHPHRFVSALTYETPWGRNMHSQTPATIKEE
jgi:hypothetical protein